MRTLKRAWTHFDQHSNQLALLVFSVSLLIYVLTLAPGLLWGGGDFSTFQTKAYTGQIERNVFGHPLGVILARPFLWLPVRDVVYGANLASAFFAAAALAFVFQAARLLTRHTAASLLATGGLLVSHTFWTYAVLPKPYSLNALLLSACLFLVLRRRESQRGKYLYLAALLYGLGPLNHLVMLTTIAGFAAFLLWSAWQQRTLRRQVLIGVVFLLIGLLPFLLLELRPDPSAGATQSIGPFLLGLLNSFTVPDRLLIGLVAGLGLFVYQFFLLVPLIAIGLWQSWKRDPPAATLLSLAALGDVAFLLNALPAHGLLFADYSIWSMVNYLQVVENARPDVRVIQLPAAGQDQQLPLLLEHQGAGELYLADTNRYYDMHLIRSHFDPIPASPIYRLRLRQ